MSFNLAGSSFFFIAYILANSKNNLFDLTSDEAKKRLEK
jgi:hypothetical protein